jgi:GT2 family glycosyltransferase
MRRLIMRATVVIPTYERPDALRATIDSVCTQTFTDYDVIVVDDGSISNEQHEVLSEISSSYERVRIMRQENRGPAAARNEGWRAVEADVVLFTDDDCIVPSDWIEQLVTAFEPEIGAVGGPLVPAETVREKPVARLHEFRNENVYNLHDEPIVGDDDLSMGGTANIAYRREALVEVDGFDESFPVAAGEDADLQKRVSDAGYRMKYVPVPVEHNDTYDFDSFVSRTVRHGTGTYWYHRRHGPPRPVWRTLLGLLAVPFFLPAVFRDTDDPVVAVLMLVERALLRIGELKAALRN